MNFFDLVLFFAIYSFLGWLMETIFASINERKFINRGFLIGPFCPIYGFGAFLIVKSSEWVNIVIENYFMSLIISVLFSVILVTILEYITGFTLEKVFNCKWWDYSNKAANLQGYICLQYSLLWGLLAFLLLQVAHPEFSKSLLFMPMSTKVYISTVLLLYFLADTTKSVMDVLDLKRIILNVFKFFSQ